MAGMLNQFIHRAEIYYLLANRPEKLFQRLNELQWYKKTLRAWINDLTLNRDAKCLDIGCGTGALTEYLAACGHCTTGVDASKKMIFSATRNRQRRARYQVADATSLPFANASFDAVASASLLNIVSDPITMMAEMARVSKHNGVVSVLIPKLGITNQQIREIAMSQCSTGFSAAALTIWHKRAPKMKSAEIERLFSDVGLEISKVKEYLDSMVISVSGVKVAE